MIAILFDMVSRDFNLESNRMKDHMEDFLVLMENYGKATEYTNISLQSSGTAMEKFANYEQSVEAKTKALQASLQELATDTLDSGIVKSFLDVSNVLVNITDKVGVFNIALVALAAVIGAKTTLGMTAFQGVLERVIIKMGVGTAAAETMGMALSTAIPVAGILLGVTALSKFIDFVVTTDKELDELSETATAAYDNAKSKLESVNAEFEKQSNLLNELLAKDTLTYVEKGQLEELQKITKELEIQQDLAQKEVERTQREAALAATKATKKYNLGELTSSGLNELMSNAEITGNNAALISDQNNLVGMIAGYKEFIKLKDEAYSSRNEDDMQHFDELTGQISDSIWENVTALQGQKDKMTDYYNAIKDTPYDKMTSDQKKVYDSYNQISSAIEKVYDELDPNKLKELNFGEIFDSQTFSKAKEELLELASAGKLSEDTISSNASYKELINNTGLTAKDVTTQIYALSDSLKESGESSENASIATKSYKEILDSVSKNVKLVAAAQYELSDSGKLSYSTVSDLLEAYPELADKLTLTENGYTTTNDALQGLIDSQINEYQLAYNDAVDACNKFIDNEKLKQAGIDATTTSIKDQMYAMLKLYETQGQANGDTLREIQNHPTYQNMLSSWMNVGITEKNLDVAKKVTKQVQKEIIDGLTDKNKSKKSKTSETIDWIAQSIQKLQNSVQDAKTEIDKFDLSDTSKKTERNAKKIIDSYQSIVKKRKDMGSDYVGNVDVNNRPIVLNSDGGYSTTRTAFQEKWVGDEKTGGYKIIHYTPILPDGTVLKGEALNTYIDKILNSSNSLKADDPKNGGYGIVYKVDTEINGKKITDNNLNSAFSVADAWDVKMHNTQDKLYKTEAESLLKINKLAKDNGLSIKQFMASVEDGTLSYKKQESLVNDLISQQEKLKSGYQSASNAYLTKYKSISGIDSYKGKIQSGSTFSSTDFSDENLYKKVKKAQDLWNNYQTQLQNVKSAENDILKSEQEIKDIKSNAIKSEFDLLEHKYNSGKIIEADYQNQRWELAKKYYWKNSEYLSEWQKEIENHHKWVVESEAETNKKRVENLTNTNSAIIDSFKSAISDTMDEVEDLDEGSQEQFDKIADAIKIAKNEADYLKKEMANLDKLLKSGKISSSDYTTLMKDLNSAMSDTKDTVKDLEDKMSKAFSANYEKVLDDLADALEAQTEALTNQKKAYDDIIDAQLELLNAEKKRHDYEESIAEKTKKVSDIQSRMAELQKAANSGDRTATKELKELQDDLADAQKDLDETQYDHKIELQEDALNKAKDGYDKLIDKEIDDAKSVYNTKLENLKKLYAEEEKLITRASQYTETEFSSKITALNTEINDIIAKINKVTGKNVEGINPDTTKDIINDQSDLVDIGADTNSTNLTSIQKAEILSILKNGTGAYYGERSSALNKYAYNQYGKALSYGQMVSIAKIFGISNINTNADVTGNETNTGAILKSLQNAGFKTGGVVGGTSNNYVKQLTGEDGLGLMRIGEGILKPKETSAVINIGNRAPELVDALNVIKSNALSPNNYTTNNNNNAPNLKFDKFINVEGNVTSDGADKLEKMIPKLAEQFMDEYMSKIIRY